MYVMGPPPGLMQMPMMMLEPNNPQFSNFIIPPKQFDFNNFQRQPFARVNTNFS